MSPIIETEKLYKTFTLGELRIEVLKDINLVIEEGEFVSIMGPSGSGKSTLLYLLGGLDKPTSGRVRFRNKELAVMTDREESILRRRHFGFVFQFYNLIPNLTAQENINLSVEIAKNPLKVEDVLKEIDLYDRKNHFPSQLSGGQQQRVAIARAIAKNPKILLCDEPTGALDLATGIQVLKLLKRFNEVHKKTVIIITHNTEISQIAHRVFYIIDGKIEKIKENPTPVSPEEVNW